MLATACAGIFPMSETFNIKNRLSDFNIDSEEILRTTQSLAVNKAHGYDDVSGWMSIHSRSFTVKPLAIIFKNCLELVIFSKD